MKLYKYLTDQILPILLFVGVLFLMLLIFIAFKANIEMSITVLILYVSSFLISFFYNYFRKKKFYDSLLNQMDNLDKKYLISCLIEKPEFYDGEILYQIIYESNKAMKEAIKEYEISVSDFKEYIEMWIHEVSKFKFNCSQS